MADLITQALGGADMTALAYSWGSSIAMILFGLGLCGGLVWLLFIKKKTKKWGIVIWEPKEDGMLIPVETDILDEKHFNQGKQVAYILRKKKIEVFPPNYKCTYRKGGKDWADYVRIQQEFFPIKKQIKAGLDKLDTIEYMQKLMELSKQHPDEIASKYIYAPVVAAPFVMFDVELMEHDVNMMRMSAIDNREKIYADKRSFMEKYGPMLGLSLLVVGIIVTAYLSFDFIVKVQSGMLGPLQSIASALKDVAANMGANAVASVPATPAPPM